jgi:uncharacterized membrane protein (DUF485 family)
VRRSTKTLPVSIECDLPDLYAAVIGATDSPSVARAVDQHQWPAVRRPLSEFEWETAGRRRLSSRTAAVPPAANSGRKQEGIQHMAALDYETIRRNPKYRQLVRQRSIFGWTLTIVMLIIYFGFILLIGYDPKFLGTRMGDSVMTVGLPIGLFVIVSAFLLVAVYVARANRTYDTLTRDIVEETR